MRSPRRPPKHCKRSRCSLLRPSNFLTRPSAILSRSQHSLHSTSIPGPIHAVSSLSCSPRRPSPPSALAPPIPRTWPSPPNSLDSDSALLSLTTVWVRIPVWTCEKVASNLGLGGGFCRILRFPPLLTTG